MKPSFKIHKRSIRTDQKSNQTEETIVPDKIIYIELDDEITEVFDRIKRVRGENIALVVPKRAYLLQSIINLRILKKKVDELGKKLILITTDLSGIQLAEKAGIVVSENIFGKTQSIDKEERKMQSSSSARPIRMASEKVSLAEVIQDDTQKTLLASIFDRIRSYIKKKKKQTNQTRIIITAPNKQALFTLVLVSVLLLLAIAYIALPGATIYLTPRSSVLDPPFNITFLDVEKNRDLLENNSGAYINIKSYALTPPPFTKKLIHYATGKIFKGENAHGFITVINESASKWELAPRTRFQTDDGLVFRTPTAVRIPASKNGVPGALDIAVVADEIDATGQIIGARGNIPKTKFFLPGLRNEESKKKLYAESKEEMKGGVTQMVKTVSKEDIEAARGAAKREVYKNAAEDLKKYLEEQNLIKKTNLSLLADRNVTKVSEPVIFIPLDIVGKPLEQFEVNVTYTARGIAFDREELTSLLKERLTSKVDPDKKIIKVYEDDISYKFLDEDINTGRVRLTATMRAIQAYELDPEKENGHRFIKKITDHIAGRRVDDTLTYLQQQTDEIERVEINLWPVWAPTIPNIADNIKFVIREDEE